MSEGWAVMVAVLTVLIGLGLYGAYAGRVDAAADAERRRSEMAVVIMRLVDATGQQEPTRADANDPLRERLVFCGRTTDHGHAPSCPWVAAVEKAYGP